MSEPKPCTPVPCTPAENLHLEILPWVPTLAELRQAGAAIVQPDRVDPRQWSNTHTPMLDQENLVALMGPGCYYCEQPWSTLLATRRCKGRP